MQTIYLDILLLESFYVNYFLLRATGRLTHTRLRICRCVFAAVVSSLFSLLLFLPSLPIVVQWLLKLGTASVTVFLAFGRSHVRFVRFRQILCFFCCSFLLAGLLLAVSSQTKQGFAAWANGYWYVDFSLLQLIVLTTLAYLALHGYHRMRGRLHVAETDYQVYLRLDGRTLVLSGLADTGNQLEDFFSGLPVIVCSAESLAQLQNGMPIEKLPHYRVIPCATVTSEGVMPLFRPDEICIRQMTQNKCKYIHTVDAMIGIAGTQKTAIFHPKLIGK